MLRGVRAAQGSILALVSALLLTGAAAGTAQAARPPLSSDATHPRIMQEAAQRVASAPVKSSTVQAPAATAPAAAPAKNLRREVFGFATSDTLSDPTVGYTTWNFSLLSTVAFFGLHVNDDGTIASDSGYTVWNSNQLTGLLSTAHAAGTKVVVTVIEQDFSSGTPHMCAALANRATTVSQTVAQVTAKSADGVNIDYEGLNGTCANGQTARAMMTDFAARMRAALPSGSYLSVDTYAGAAADSLGFFDIAGLNSSVDAFFVMAYDLENSNYAFSPPGCSSFCLGPTAPLTTYHYNDTTVSSQYVAVVPASKVLLGVPYYGRKACVASASPNQVPTGAVSVDTYLTAAGESAQPEVQAGSYVIHRDPNDPAGQERWDTWYNTTLKCTRELYWDDTVSLGKKYDLVNSDALRGVGIWNLNYGGGASELWNTLYTHFASCTSAALASAPAVPQPPGTSVQLTATSTGCPSPEYRFFVQPPGGAWTAQTGYGGASWTWNTSGLAPGVYGIGVWVREAGSGVSYDAYSLATYALGYATCTAATITPSVPTPQAPGAAITFTGAATGCPNPQFRFWLLPPGGSWTMKQDWGGSTWTWNTTGATPGVYQVGVWSRQAGSPGSYDAFGITTFTLGVTGCTGAAMTSDVATPQAPGTAITFSATSTGCANPQYQFWLLQPGGTWTVQRPYGASAWQWSTAGLATGTYQVGVWVKQSTSSAAYDAYFIGTYQLVIAYCSSATLTPTPASPQAPGTQVTLTAASTGCTDPRYEFWLLPPPGTSWKITQPYGTGATSTWDTTGLAPGPYRLGVWARQNGSSNAYDTYAIVTFWVGP